MNKIVINGQTVDLDKVVKDGVLVVKDIGTCKKIMQELEKRGMTSSSDGVMFTDDKATCSSVASTLSKILNVNTSQKVIGNMSETYMKLKAIMEGNDSGDVETIQTLVKEFTNSLSRIMKAPSNSNCCVDTNGEEDDDTNMVDSTFFTVRQLTELMNFFVKNDYFAKTKAGYVTCIPVDNGMFNRYSFIIRKNKKMAYIAVNVENVSLADTWKEANPIGKKFNPISASAFNYLYRVAEFDYSFDMDKFSEKITEG